MTKEEIIEQVEYYISDPARWHNSNGKARIALSTMIEELITAPTAKPNVSGELLSDVDYWKQRCLLAEQCLEESPCDPDITSEQIKAHNAYNKFISWAGNDR